MGNAEPLGRALRRSGFLVIRCMADVDGKRCGHEVNMPADVALKLFGPGAHRHDVTSRLRCRACGKKGSVDVGVR